MDKLFLLILLISLFAGSLLLLYPLIAFLKAAIIKKPVNSLSGYTKPVSIIIAAYNEEELLESKINFFLQESEWIEGSEIIVISAGSTDGTNEILKRFSKNPNFISIILNEHIIKPLALNIAFNKSKNDILLFSDCRQIIKNGSVKNILQYFNDANIGVVNSTICDTKKGNKMSLMRSILNSICLNDSASGSSLNIHGAFYAQRRETFRPFPEDILFDDLFAVVSTINQHKRIIQVSDVEIYDVNFEKYYNKNRIERLARGLIIFLLGYWPVIKQMPFTVFLRFIIYRYFKLLMPFIVLGIFLPVIYFVVKKGSIEMQFLFLIAFLVLIVFGKTRRFIIHLSKINFYFASAIFKFFVRNKREVSWDKLAPEQTQ